MKGKLTLSIDKEAKRRAARRAKSEGKSISQIIEDLLSDLPEPNSKELPREQQWAEAGIEEWAKNLG